MRRRRAASSLPILGLFPRCGGTARSTPLVWASLLSLLLLACVSIFLANSRISSDSPDTERSNVPASEGDFGSPSEFGDVEELSFSGRSAEADVTGADIPAPAITGIVLGPRGAPVVGATITAIEEAVLPGDPFTEEFTTTAITDEVGAFRVGCAAVGSHRVHVVAPGMTEERLADCRAGDHLEVFLCQGASITGRVCYPDDGRVVPGIEVRAGGRRAVADASGFFQLDGLAPGTTFISTESNWNGWAGAFESIELVEGDVAWVDLELRAGVTVVGRVVDRRDYSPIVGADISLGEGRPLATTDERGRYRIEGYSRIVDLSDPLSASAPGFGVEVGHPIERDDAVYLLNFALGPTLRLSGQVTDGEDPVERAIVRVRARRIGDRPLEFATGVTVAPPVEVVTDLAGEFTVPAISAGAHRYVVEVKRAGYGDFSKEWAIAGTEPFDLGAIALATESWIEGVIFDEVGDPIPGVGVLLRRTYPHGSELTERVVRTDASGQFRFAGVGSGTYELTGLGDSLVLDRKRVTIETAGTVESIEWLALSALEIRGVVQDLWYRPVAGIEVECASEDHFPFLRTTTTEPDGSFTFRGVPDGNYQLRARGEGGETGCVKRGVIPEDGCPTLILEPLVSVSGRVTDGDGFPYNGAFVVLLPPAGGLGIELRQTVDSEGRFSFPVDTGGGDLMIIAWPSEESWLTSLVEGSSNPFERVIDPSGVVHRCAPGDVIDPIVLDGR